MRSRRDLKRVNALMANGRIVAAELRRLLPAGARSIVEIGAGDGSFALGLARALAPALPGARFMLLDRQPLVDAQALAGFARHGWCASALACDVFDWLAGPVERHDAIVANLFLHHFEPAALARLLAGVAARTDCFVACEPRRGAFALAGSHLLGLVGCNDVTRHDAVVSVRAGFAGNEIGSLWPPGWQLSEAPRGAFSHCFAARRR